MTLDLQILKLKSGKNWNLKIVPVLQRLSNIKTTNYEKAEAEQVNMTAI